MTCRIIDVNELDGILRGYVAAAIEGDDVAIREFVRLTQPAVWRLCSALGSRGEEDDLAQETFIRVLRSLPNFRGESSVIGWVLAIARHVCADHVRSRKRQRRLLGAIKGCTTDRMVIDADHAVWDILRRIDPDRCEAFVLTQVAGLSYEETAAALGCPIGTVRSRVARARADLTSAVHAAEAS
jgi:RNA polymerase sigma-70 factor (ECF subfamily)